MVVFVYLHITLLHYHHYADDVYEGIGLLKCLSDTSCRVCVLDEVNSRNCLSCNLYIQVTHFSYGDCENTCNLSYNHCEIEMVTHLPLFRARS